MPNYDYLCLNCGNRFEEFQKMTDPVLTECPACKGNVKRLIGSGLGPIFKGSGFYQTDYKNTSSAKSGENKSSENTAKKESVDKKSEFKTTKKPE